MAPDRIEALRTAFDETMKDAGFLAEAKKSGMDVKPMSGAIQKLVEEIVASSPADVELAAQLVK